MMETECFQTMLRRLMEELVRDPGLSDTQVFVRCRALLDLLKEIEELIRQNCRRDRFRGELVENAKKAQKLM